MVEQSVLLLTIRNEPSATQADLRRKYKTNSISRTISQLQRWGLIERRHHGQTYKLYITEKGIAYDAQQKRID